MPEENVPDVSVAVPSDNVPCERVNCRVDPRVKLPAREIVPEALLTVTGASSVTPFDVMVPVPAKVSVFEELNVMPALNVKSP